MPAAKIINWNDIVAALKNWRKNLQKSGASDPSVTTVAERYKNDPWAVLVSTILSLRTKDEVTLKCSHALLAKAPTPKKLLALKEETIAQLAYPAGFYRTKAANLKKIAALLLEHHEGKVPADMDTLLTLPGVGRKTANLVLIEAFNIDGICVDIHVHRISNRTGWLVSQNPEETEMILRQILPRKYWKALNPLLVLYGQNICRPVSPYCSQCVIGPHCKRVGVEKTR
jgi:endonuclease-3